eukprot:TRINITY_DN2969_c2_g4_i1.p1 TRINITY_DN2969_c2_g4~~TRINITY_DN2969_c2_g4_i1.p1  ORF type:complete len:926 (-),score=373.97 TRINITY_DN2969_c2_g4_i1:52-2802(-)
MSEFVSFVSRIRPFLNDLGEKGEKSPIMVFESDNDDSENTIPKGKITIGNKGFEGGAVYNSESKSFEIFDSIIIDKMDSLFYKDEEEEDDDDEGEEETKTLFITTFGELTSGKSHTLFNGNQKDYGLFVNICEELLGLGFEEEEEEAEIDKKSFKLSGIQFFADECFDITNEKPKKIRNLEMDSLEGIKVTQPSDFRLFLRNFLNNLNVNAIQSNFGFNVVIFEIDGYNEFDDYKIFLIDTPSLNLTEDIEKDLKMKKVYETFETFLTCLSLVQTKQVSLQCGRSKVTEFFRDYINNDSEYVNIFCYCPVSSHIENSQKLLEIENVFAKSGENFAHLLPSVEIEFKDMNISGNASNKDLLEKYQEELRIVYEVYEHEPKLATVNANGDNLRRYADQIIRKMLSDKERQTSKHEREIQSGLRSSFEREFKEFKDEYEREHEKAREQWQKESDLQQKEIVNDFKKLNQANEAKIKQLTAQLANSKVLNSSNTKLQANLEKSLERVAELEEIIEMLKIKKEEQLNELDKETSELKKELRKKTNQNLKLEEELERLKKKFDLKKAEGQKKDKKIKKLQQEIQSKEKEFEEKFEMLKEVPTEQAVQRIEETIAVEQDVVNSDEYEELLRELDDVKRQKEELASALIELKSRGGWIDDEAGDDFRNRTTKNPETMLRRTRDDEMEDFEYEGAYGHENTLDLIEKVLQYLEQGVVMVKHGRAGKPHVRMFHLSKDRTKISWHQRSIGDDDDSHDKFVELADVTRLILGQHTDVFQRQVAIDPEDDEKSFSLVVGTGSRTLDCVCDSLMDFEAWIMGLSHLLPVEPAWGSTLDLAPFPLATQLDAEERDMCERYRIIPEQYIAIKQLIVEECWERGYITKADVRVIGRIDFFRASQIHDLMEKRRWICSVPLFEDDPPLIDPFE